MPNPTINLDDINDAEELAAALKGFQDRGLSPDACIEVFSGGGDGGETHDTTSIRHIPNLYANGYQPVGDSPNASGDYEPISPQAHYKIISRELKEAGVAIPSEYDPDIVVGRAPGGSCAVRRS
ncbi:MAG: hypothetical protein J0M34_02500 [Alphaproteobacteria bacterium]|nr:hypothetical protein [Alphaproteobacteria bacterium]